MKSLSLSIAILSSLVLSGCDNSADDPSGLHYSAFEHVTPFGHPMGWYIEADAAMASVSVDVSRAVDDRMSLHVRNQGNEAVVMYTPLDLDNCLSVLNASAQAIVSSTDVSVQLFFLLPGKPQMGEATSPTDAWSTISVSRSADGKCLDRKLMLGILMSGKGEAWIDVVQLESAGKAVELKGNEMRPPGEHELAAMRDAAFGFDDADALLSAVGNARVVGLGENSHGAAALFAAKLEMMKILIQQGGFDVFALEMPAEPASIVNDYVLGRSDDEERVLRALSYPAWQTDAMWAVIEWLREYNMKNEPQVTLRGLDTPRDDERSDDDRMAVEVSRLLSEDADRRIIVWADNTHVTKAGDAMGAQLDNTLGHAYVAIGLTFNEGEYSAYGPKKRYPVHPAYPGTHEAVLAEAGGDAFLLELDKLPALHPLRERRGYRYIGSHPQPFNQFYPHRLDEHFDIVGFVKETQATEYLLPHEF